MPDSPFNYDVAFSFLAQDEALACQLNDLLQDRLKTFLYSKRQGELAGTDGESTFGRVFGEEARLVVVLYRSGWGETPWTRIEETSIRNRAFEHGYDFVVFVPLDEPASVPRWLPRNRLWVGFKRWGTEGAASVIESRVQELGGEPSEESVVGRAARLERSLQHAERRKRFLGSDEGVRAANTEIDTLHTELLRRIDEVKCAAPSVSIHLKRDGRLLVLLGFGLGLSTYWHYHYANSLDGATLEVTLWDGHPPFTGIMHFEKPHKLRTLHFTFDLLVSNEPCWRQSEDASRALTTKDISAFLMKFLMEQGEKAKDKER